MQIAAIVARVEQRLGERPDDVLAWELIPLDFYTAPYVETNVACADDEEPREIVGPMVGEHDAHRVEHLQESFLWRPSNVDRNPDMLNFGPIAELAECEGMEVAELLKQTPLFENLSEDNIELLAQSTRIQNYKAGQLIVSEGRVGAAFFILVSGSVEVVKRRGESDEVVLATLGTGDFFGELATMKHVPRSASVRALQDTTCLAIWRADFESYIRQFPDVAAKVESTLIARFGEGQYPEE